MHRKKPCGAGLRPTGTISLEEHRVGGTEICWLKTDPQLTMLSLCLLARCLTNFDFGSLIALRSAPQPYTIWRGPTHVSKF